MRLTKLSNKSVSYLLELERSKKVFDLKNISRFLKLLGDPQDNLKTIHIAGTNGKGSVAAMLSAVLTKAGYKTGMFTSPHLVKLNERFRINNKPISDQALDELAKKAIKLQKVNKIDLTFFETVTIMAFLYFNRQKVDYAIIESGLGGRLDATNTISNPVLSIITNIGKDHTELLGNTITKIAKEKAGIIKQDSTVITNAKGPALNVIKSTCKKHNTKLILGKKTNFKTNLKGEFQKENLSTAVTALKQLKIKKKHIRSGLKKVQWPARFEFFNKKIILDCAHNKEAMQSLTASIKQLKYKNLILVISLMYDKDAKQIAGILKKLNPTVIVTRAKVSRAADPKDIAAHFPNSIIIPNVKKAIEKAKDISKRKDKILITGSIYLVGEVYSFLNHQTPK